MTTRGHTIGFSRVDTILLSWFLCRWEEDDRAEVLADLADETGLVLDEAVAAALADTAAEFAAWASATAGTPLVSVLGPTTASSIFPYGRAGCGWESAGINCNLPAGHDGSHNWPEPVSVFDTAKLP
jgi:hypothetical protein